MHRNVYLGLATATLALMGCQEDGYTPPTGAGAASLSLSATPTKPVALFNLCDPVVIDQSVVIRDQATIAGNFDFEKVIEAIRLSSGGSATTNDDLAQSLTSGLLTNPFSQPVSGLPIPAALRTPEAALTGSALNSQMRPIALFNRFDLAPSDGAHCGEYRIVYGRYPNSSTNRYLLIFEAALPNPDPGAGLEGCRPVAEFWHSLSDPSMTTAQRATALEDFYFNGLTGFDPVVQHANYGFPLGQVRSNMFKDASVLGFSWQLREWRTGLDGSGKPVFVPDTDKDNPLAEFYDENSSNPDPAGFAVEQADFLNHFTSDVMTNLLQFELGGTTAVACPQINAFGAGFANRFNEFQSTAGPTDVDDPAAIASPVFRSNVSGAIPGGAPGITDDHVINRATAMTCAGCHEVSNGAPISPTASWPPSARFVHVDEQGPTPPSIAPLSSALTNCFLPHRRDILEGFVCTSGGGGDAGVGDGGGSGDGGTTPDAGFDAGTPDSGTPTTCGGPYGGTCPSGQYCEFGNYNICGASGTGTCLPAPVSCLYTSPNAVCGCDGQSYSNECLAQQAGVDVQHQGACGCKLKPPTGCCFEDSQCGKGGVCAGASCGKRSAGVCKGPPPVRGSCWTSDQCGAGMVCKGAIVCPCGQRCLQRDQPGKCEKLRVSLSPALSEATKSLLQSSTDAQREAAVEKIDAAVEAERELERSKPGAFVPVRRSH